MQDAISRHYEKMRQLEDQKKMEKQDFEWRCQAAKDMDNADRERKRVHAAKLQKSLMSQIAARQSQRADERKEDSLIAVVGPSEEELLSQHQHKDAIRKQVQLE